MTENTRSLSLFESMVRIRTFEDRVGELFVRGGTAGSMLHLSIGEEGAAVGVVSAMAAQDRFTAHHRGHGIFLARGADPNRMMAEIAGAEAGYCRGKGGSMHIADMELGHLGANAIVGGGIAAAVGAGLSSKMLRQNSVAVAFFGDGAVQQGVLYESMNLAAIWHLPVLFVVINNQYGMATRIDQATANLDFIARAQAFGLAGSSADGLDVEAVRSEAENLIAQARNGQPGFLTVECYRFHGHARKDKSPYRSETEEQEGRKRDPIAFQRERVIAEGIADGETCDAIVAKAESEMDNALAFAEETASPALEEMFDDVYSEGMTGPEPVDQRIERLLPR